MAEEFKLNIIMEEITKNIKQCKTFYDFLVLIRDTKNLKLINDNGWTFLEYEGVEIEGTSKERFNKSSEIDDLIKLSGLNNR